MKILYLAFLALVASDFRPFPGVSPPKKLCRTGLLVLAPFLAALLCVQLPFPAQTLWAGSFPVLGPQQWDKSSGRAELPLAKISPDGAVSG